jgi:hypothetical protein
MTGYSPLISSLATGYSIHVVHGRRARYIAALQAADAGDCQPLLVFLDNA